MKAANIYLNFLGNTEEAFNHYKKVFGGDFSMLQRFGDTPYGAELPEGDRNKIMHVALELAPGYMLMGTDALESAGHALNVGNNINISIHPDSEAEADKIFKGLEEGGVVEMPLQKTFWGAYYGALADKFGIRWMINYEYPKE